MKCVTRDFLLQCHSFTWPDFFCQVFHITQKTQEPGPPPTHTHNIPEVFVVSVTYLKLLLVLALNRVATISIGVHSVQHFRIPICTQRNNYQEGERFKAGGSNRACRWHTDWQNWTKLVQDWRETSTRKCLVQQQTDMFASSPRNAAGEPAVFASKAVILKQDWTFWAEEIKRSSCQWTTELSKLHAPVYRKLTHSTDCH